MAKNAASVRPGAIPCIKPCKEENSMRVKAILEQKGRAVLTTSPQATVREAARLLSEHHVGAVIIVDQHEHIVGIVAERDIVAAVAQHGAEALDKPVLLVMWKNVHRCSEDTSVGELMAMMSAKRARHIPVETHGRLAGIISIGDVVKAHIRQIEHEAEEMKAYIAS
jgi:CBS domain-containing protein